MLCRIGTVFLFHSYSKDFDYIKNLISLDLCQICEIVGVQETPKIYTMGSTKTNQGLRLRLVYVVCTCTSAYKQKMCSLEYRISVEYEVDHTQQLLCVLCTLIAILAIGTNANGYDITVLQPLL